MEHKRATMSHMIKTSPFLPYFTSKTNEISILPMTYVHTASVNRKAAIGKCHTLFICIVSMRAFVALQVTTRLSRFLILSMNV